MASADDAGSEGLTLEEVIVTAQKRKQSVTDVPMSITAMTGEFMSDAGIEDSTDLAIFVPGMSYSDTATGTPIYTIRGVGFNDSSTQAAATVGVYYDELGVPLPIMTRRLMLDVERLEVLKGPPGTLYGRNSTGGAINYIAAKPTDEFEASVGTSYGTFGEWYLDGMISGGLGEVARARLAFKTLNSNGWQESISRNEKHGDLDKFAVRLLVDLDLGEHASMLLSANYWNDQSDTLVPQFLNGGYANLGPVADVIRTHEPLPGSIRENAKDAEWTEGRDPAFDMKNTSLGMTIKADVSDNMQFTSLTGYHSFKDDGSEFNRSGIAGVPVSDATRPFMNGDIANLSDGDILTNDYSTIYSDIDAFSQELRLSGDTDKISWVGGLYYAKTEVDNVANQSFNITTSTNGLFGGAPFGNFPAIDNKGKQKQNTGDIFGSVDWRIGDKLTLTTGLRYTKDKIDFDGCTADTGDGASSGFFSILTGFIWVNVLGQDPSTIPPTPAPGQCVTWNLLPGLPVGPAGLVHRELDEDSWSWRLAADYDVSDDTSVYASYSRGFKSGSFPTLGASNSNQFKPVVQEQVDAYEIGFKSTLAEGAAQLNGAVYYYDYTDKQLLTKISDPVFGRLFALNNVDDSRVWGAEIDFKWLPAEGWTLGGAVSYTDTKIGSFIGSNQLGQEIEFDGSEFPFAPNWQATVNAQYDWAFSANKMGFVAVDASYSGSTQSDYKSKDLTTTGGQPYQYDPLFDIDGYTIINARLGVASQDGSWRAFLYARNLTDEFYYTNVLQAIDMQTRYAGKPSTYGITFQYNW